MKSSITAANELLNLAKNKNETLTPMQLIKLVFLCHGWMLGLYGRHLIKDTIEAWRYGPVIPNLYQEIKKFKSSPVEFPIANCLTEKPDDIESNIISQVYELYGHLSGIELSTLTHMPNSPWDMTWKNRKTYISNDLIEFYYRKKAEQK